MRKAILTAVTTTLLLAGLWITGAMGQIVNKTVMYLETVQTITGLKSFPGGVNLTGGRPGTQVVEVCKSGCKYSDPQLAVNSITDASAAKPYTVLVYPGVYDLDRMVNKGAITGTISVTNGQTAVVGTDTLFTTELIAGEFIKLSAHADSAFSYIASITDNTHLTLITSGVGQFRLGTAPYPQNGYLGATGSGAASRGWSYCPSIDMTGSDGTVDGFGCGALAGGGRDYISLVGVDRRGTIIQRERAAGVLTPTIQGSTHTKIENLTLYSPANRMIHWDTWGSLDLNRIDMKTCQPGIGCAGGGISSGSGTVAPDLATYINISDNYVENGSFAIHGGTCAAGGLVRAWFTGNTFGAFGTAIGMDLATGGDPDCSWEIMVTGSVQRYYSGDPAGGFVLDLPSDPTARAKVNVFTDGSLRVNSNAATEGTTFYNHFVYPQTRPLLYKATVDSFSSGDLFVYAPATNDLRATTTANAQFPFVVTPTGQVSAPAGEYPRIVTGDYAAVFVAAGTAVAIGDILVTSTTAKDASVNNDQADVTRILGWAESTKAAGSRSLVNVRLNKAVGATGATWGPLQTFSGGFKRPTVKIKEVCPSGCEFTSITAALAAITDASASKRYTILLYPGEYAETFDAKSYVTIKGLGRTVTRIIGLDVAGSRTITQPADVTEFGLEGVTVGGVIPISLSSGSTVETTLYVNDSILGITDGSDGHTTVPVDGIASSSGKLRTIYAWNNLYRSTWDCTVIGLDDSYWGWNNHCRSVQPAGATHAQSCWYVQIGGAGAQYHVINETCEVVSNVSSGITDVMFGFFSSVLSGTETHAVVWDVRDTTISLSVSANASASSTATCMSIGITPTIEAGFSYDFNNVDCTTTTTVAGQTATGLKILNDTDFAGVNFLWNGGRIKHSGPGTLVEVNNAVTASGATVSIIGVKHTGAYSGAGTTLVDAILANGAHRLTPLATAPATCSIGDHYTDTSGADCACSATNTWSNTIATGSCV